ncbi:MAG: replication initiator [Gaiellaceae bacterium]
MRSVRVAGVPVSPTPSIGDLASRSSPPEPASNSNFRSFVNRKAGLCERPVIIAAAHDTPSIGSLLYVPCGSRRADNCQSCSETYRKMAFLVIASGGPVDHPGCSYLWVTLTAPGADYFGTRTHTYDAAYWKATARGKKPSRRPLVCCGGRSPCPTCGKPMVCGKVHSPDQRNELIGAPVPGHEACFDYDLAASWNREQPLLWSRTIQLLRRKLSLHDADERARVQFCRVSEFQARGLHHAHCLVRAAPGIGIERLRIAMTEAVGEACANGHRWGAPRIEPIRRRKHESVRERVGYAAKYATKSVESLWREAVPSSPLSRHRRALAIAAGSRPIPGVEAAWWELADFRYGCGGQHVLTKSHDWGTSFAALRRARSAGVAKSETSWRYYGRGWLPEHEAMGAVVRELREPAALPRPPSALEAAALATRWIVSGASRVALAAVERAPTIDAKGRKAFRLFPVEPGTITFVT